MRSRRNISRLLAVLVIWVLLFSPALQVSAASSDLYGTGSADEINIIKLLDMALNKGGMSMSPATIRSFLEYWWSSVQEDLSTCIGNADAAITTTQAFADYVISALEDADHYDKLGPIIIKYVRYVSAMEGKSLSDIKQLLLQPETFRRFLLSYVVDEDGNIAGTVDNKIKRYNLKNEFVNMTRQAAEAYIEEYEGYYLLKTFSYKDFAPSDFFLKDDYDTFRSMFSDMPADSIFILGMPMYSYYGQINDQKFSLYRLDEFNPILSYNYSDSFGVNFYSDNWNYYAAFIIMSNTSNPDFTSFDSTSKTSTPFACRINTCGLIVGSSTVSNVFSSDGRTVKIWKSLDAFKAASAGKSNIYYSNSYAGYDSSVDNSVAFTGSYYSSSSYSHDVIQTNIDNSSEINESTINNIVNNYITNNNYGDSSGSSGSGGGSGSSGNGWWNIGDGINALIEGVAALLDFLLKLIGDLIGLLSSFLTGLLEAMGKIAELGQGFSNFLTAAFGFIPEECISLIVASVGVMCAVGVFKIFKK